MNPKKLKRLLGQPVWVTWEDAVGDLGWKKMEEIEDKCPSQVEAIGILASVTESHLTLVMNVINDSEGRLDHAFGSFTIPEGMVQKVRELHRRSKNGNR